MFLLGLLGSLITGGFSLAGDFVKGKNEKARLVLENEKLAEEAKAKLIIASAEAKAAAMKTRMEGDVAWEAIWSKGAQGSWKDEAWTVVLIWPYLLTFIPATMNTFIDPLNGGMYAKEMLGTIAEFPEMYNYFTGIAISAAFGFKGVKNSVVDFFSTKKGI